MYGLDGREFESRYCKVIFLESETSRKALGSSQTPIQWIPVFFHGDEAAGAWRWLSSARLRRSRAIPLLPLYNILYFGFSFYFCNGNSSNRNDLAVLPLFHIVPATTEAWSYPGTWFLCAFAKWRKPTTNFVMSARLSVCPRGTTRHSVEEFSWTLLFDDLSEIHSASTKF
jgi:hypothetical protein